MIKPTRVLMLIRGCPGSGKSTLAHYIWDSGVIFEADKYFYDTDGNYNFDITKLKDAHAWCLAKVQDAMEQNQSTMGKYYPDIVVSNTFTQEWEMESYLKLANTYEYDVVTLIVENRHGSKNLHGVPEENVQQMRDQFDIKL